MVRSGYVSSLVQSRVEGSYLVISAIISLGPTMTEVPLSTMALRLLEVE